jgi:hypothetical protein
MRFDGVRIRVHQLEKHVERPVRLLGDEKIEAGQIIRMQLAGRTGQRLPQPKCPARIPITSAATTNTHVSSGRSDMAVRWPT